MRALGHIHKKRGWKARPQHSIIARPVRSANNHRKFRDACVADGHDHLCAIFSDAFVFVFFANHETCDVLQKDQRNSALLTKLDKVRCLQGTFAEQNAVVTDNAHRVTVDARKTGDDRFSIATFEFVKLTAHQQCGR